MGSGGAFLESLYPPHTCNGKECLVCDSALNENEGNREYEHLKVLVFSTNLTKLFTETLVSYGLLRAGTPGSISEKNQYKVST